MAQALCSSRYVPKTGHAGSTALRAQRAALALCVKRTEKPAPAQQESDSDVNFG